MVTISACKKDKETPPVAEFTASSTSIVKGNAVTFSDQSTGEPTTWSWTFTGGTPASSASQNPAVTYNSAGTYNVSLTVSNGAGSDTKTKTGYIIVTNPAGGALDADFSTPATTIVTHQTITFTDQSSGSPVSWLWSFTNGTPATSTAQNPQVKWGQQGAFTVSLTVTDAAGGTSTETKSQYILAAANLLFWKNFDGPNVKVYACPMPGTPYNASQPTVNLKGTITSYQSSAPSCGATSGWVSTIAQGFINYYCLEEGTGRHWSGNNYDVPTGSCANIGLTNANAD
jgi:PKD repeat protein